MIQDFIDAYNAIKDPVQRKLAVSQLNHLIDSKNIEDEINKDSERITSLFDSCSGNHTFDSSHYFLVGDIRSETCVLRIKEVANIDLIFTSPPYNAGISYDSWNDKLSISEYKDFLRDSINSCDKLLKDGGRFVINIRDISVATGERFPIVVFLHDLLCIQKKYKYRGVHIWYKGREESSFAWGSYKSSNNPSIIDLFEYVYVFQKPGTREATGIDDIEKTDFIENVMGIWKIRPVKKIVGFEKKNTHNHPCPFPSELARRVIKLYTKTGDTVLDPFSGSGSTAVGAVEAGRNSVCVDISENYIQFATNRLRKNFYGLKIGTL